MTGRSEKTYESGGKEAVCHDVLSCIQREGFIPSKEDMSPIARVSNAELGEGIAKIAPKRR